MGGLNECWLVKRILLFAGAASSYLLFLPSILAGGLGVWQIERRGWKVELSIIALREGESFHICDQLVHVMVDYS